MNMQQEFILLPALALVLLAMLVWLYLYFVRFRAIKNLRIKYRLSRSYLGDDIFPESATAALHNLESLLQIPALFFIAIILIYVTRSTDSTYLILTWSFVCFCYIHSLIHLTYNKLLHRVGIYVISCIVLWIIWIRIAIHVISDVLS